MKTFREISLGVLLAALLLCLFMLPAFATGSHHGPTPSPQPPAPSSNTVLQASQTKSSANSQSKSAAKSSAAARSQATSGSSSKASGGKAASQSNAAGGNASLSSALTVTTAPVISVDASDRSASSTETGDQEITIHGDTIEAPRIPVNTAIAGGTNTTASCRYSVGGGGQGSFLGLSFGLGRKDRDCERLILADRFYDSGNPDAGDVIMCRIRELHEAFGDDCLVMLRRSRTPAVTAPPVPTQHQQEQREAFERGEHLK